MSGVMEQLASKADTLIEALNTHTQVMREFMASGASAPAEPAKRGRPAKAKDEPAAGPTTTEAELVAKFEELKATDTDKRMPALRKIIAEAGFASLKELRMAPAKFDEVMKALTDYEATLGAAVEEDDDL